MSLVFGCVIAFSSASVMADPPYKLQPYEVNSEKIFPNGNLQGNVKKPDVFQNPVNQAVVVNVEDLDFEKKDPKVIDALKSHIKGILTFKRTVEEAKKEFEEIENSGQVSNSEFLEALLFSARTIDQIMIK